MSKRELVYEELASVLVPMTGVEGVHYRVFVGTVNWERTPSGARDAACVLIQHGATREWSEAKSNREIRFQMPAHVLKEDIAAVTAALADLTAKHLASSSRPLRCSPRAPVAQLDRAPLS